MVNRPYKWVTQMCEFSVSKMDFLKVHVCACVCVCVFCSSSFFLFIDTRSGCLHWWRFAYFSFALFVALFSGFCLRVCAVVVSGSACSESEAACRGKWVSFCSEKQSETSSQCHDAPSKSLWSWRAGLAVLLLPSLGCCTCWMCPRGTREHFS